MLDFSVFDSILDAAFVVNECGRIEYTNDAGATFCQSSVRRLVGKVIISDLIKFAEPGILPFNERSQGWSSATPFIETEYSLIRVERHGKVQLTIRPIDTSHWAFFLRDVSLEEALHSKYRAELAQKEEYARNLEKLVEMRTAELRKVNQTLNAILDSLGQGFFTFNLDGNCGSVFTKACLNILEGNPANRKVWEVLGVPNQDIKQFQQWFATLFQEILPFDDMKELGPNIFNHSHGQRIVLDYHPIRQDEKITDVVVVATDKTAEYKAQEALETERQYAAMVVKFIKNKSQFLQFLSSVTETLKFLLGKDSSKDYQITETLRVLHTLEGEAGIFSLHHLRESARLAQQVLEGCKAKGDLSAQALSSYYECLVEMERKHKSFLKDNEDVFSIKHGMTRILEVPYPSVVSYLSELRASGINHLVERFQDLFLRVRLIDRLHHYDALVAAVAERLGKKVKPIEFKGDVLIFPDYYEGMIAALVHSFRNAVDHGLELPEEREWAGKDSAGQIRVIVEENGEGFRLLISDDGRGIDPDGIRAKLREKFPQRDFSEQSDEDVIQNVFDSGFSSRDTVGEFSGRGVGLDALKEEVLKLGGQIHLKSKVGHGVELEIILPEITPEKPILRSA